MKTQLQLIAEEVERLIGNEHAQVSTTVVTGYDESGLVGTSDAFLRLAKELILFVDSAQRGEATQMEYDGVIVRASTSIAQVFDSSCEIHFDTVDLTASEQETEQVSDYCKRISPLSP